MTPYQFACWKRKVTREKNRRENTVRLLRMGFVVPCDNIYGGCWETVKQGDRYAMRGRYMYCSQECADEDQLREKRWKKEAPNGLKEGEE